MKKLRVLAIMILVLLTLDFALLLYLLIKGNYTMFYWAGGVLVALIIVGFVLKKARDTIEEREKEAPENTDENKDENL